MSEFHITLVETRHDGEVVIKEYPINEWMETLTACFSTCGGRDSHQFLKTVRIYLVNQVGPAGSPVDSVVVYEWIGKWEMG